MDKVYLILLTVAAILLVLDAFSDSSRDNGRRRLVVRLLPLALLFWLLVPWLTYADRVF